jgi:hypothetical protein
MLFGHLVYFVVICYTFPHFGILDQEKSGNPGSEGHTTQEWLKKETLKNEI